MTENKQDLFEKRKETVLKLISDPVYTPMKEKELAIVLQVSRENREELKAVLTALISDGKISVSKRGKYSKAEQEELIGTFTAHPKGFGFVEVEGRKEDIYIPDAELCGALHRDIVQVKLLPGSAGRRVEGHIVKILDHGIKELVGTYHASQNYGFVIPDNRRILFDIFIPKGKSGGASGGQKVLVRLTDYGIGTYPDADDKKRPGKSRPLKNPEGEVTEIIGYADDPGTDISSVVYAYELPTEFPQSVLDQAEKVKDRVTDRDCAGRLDLREIQMVTIDGEDAKDLDDAVSLTFDGTLYHLGVHIADVSEYVLENSALDQEAWKRGTSVYLADRVIPMLPRKLSNGICSLNQRENRLALSCLMDIDRQGKVISHQIAETAIRVDRRMTYAKVTELLQKARDGEPVEDEFSEFLPMFQRMEELSLLLRGRRRTRGSIDFDFSETKIVLDERGVPVDIRPYDRNAAARLIEDFMLIANETVAEDYFWQDIPFLYRSHESPDPERMRKLAVFIRNFGYGMKSVREEIHPKEIQKLLDKIEGSPEEMLISRLALRSMKQAGYTTECSGHFGLAAKYYCHFTSPIRRYPDLQIHRIIKDVLHGRMDEALRMHYEELLPRAAEQSSKTERTAEEAEREVEKLKKAQYMEQRTGQVYEGVISGITGYGIYVELENTVEGMVHVSNMMDDHYYYREETFDMVGLHTGKVYSLGEKVTVRVLSADRDNRTIDFIFEEGQGERWEKSQKN